ncbi:MAG: PTS sugar transporter subunit IIA, partial [Rhodoferax sp.]
MTTGILIIAHAPLASALRACVLHVFPEVEQSLSALDVQANEPPTDTLAIARMVVEQLNAPSVLVLTDVFGATPCNVAQQ